jgi:glutamate synthase domain-containing protein 3
MTKGTVLVLGKTGRNFAAGMSGGVAYVYDADESFARQLQHEHGGARSDGGADLATIKDLIHRHYEYTESTVAWRICRAGRIRRATS